MVRIRTVEPLPGYRLRMELTDGRTIERDLSGELWGPVFEPLKDPAFFAQVRVDPGSGTVVWPNGADFDPDVLDLGRDRRAARDARPSPADAFKS